MKYFLPLSFYSLGYSLNYNTAIYNIISENVRFLKNTYYNCNKRKKMFALQKFYLTKLFKVLQDNHQSYLYLYH